MRRGAFTLIELLIVVAIIVTLIGILMPSLSKARETALVVACLSNQRQIGIAVHSYADDFGTIPYGPKAPPPSPINFYPTTGSVTSLIGLQKGAPVGLGLLLSSYLAHCPDVLFCPGADQPLDTARELAKVGDAQAQGGYYYRHGSGGSLTVSPGPEHIRIDNLGNNSDGLPIRALAIDLNQLANRELAAFGIQTRTSHLALTANVLFADGHAASVPNPDGSFTVNIASDPYSGFAKILRALELADRH